MKYFTIKELVRSTVASKAKINNTPTDTHKQHLIELVEKLLDPLRGEWEEYCKTNHLGNPGIRVNSGYRSKQLNEAIGGAKNSAHMLGYAADIEPINGNMNEFQEWIRKAITKYNWDQLIFEKPKAGIASWIHIGYKNKDNEQRRQMFTLI